MGFCHSSRSVKILMVEFNFSSAQTMMDGFLDCLTAHNAQNKFFTFDSILFRNCVETSVTEVLLLCQQAMNQAGTDFLLSQTFHHLLGHTVPYSNLCCHFPVISWLSLMSSLISPLFLSVEGICGWPKWGWWATSVFPSLKCLTACLPC